MGIIINKIKKTTTENKLNILELLFLALALAVDTFVVSFSYGLSCQGKKNIEAFKVAFSVGLGQFIMPIIGWYGACQIYNHIAPIDHWVAFFVFLVLGIKTITNSFKSCDCQCSIVAGIGLKELFLIGVATSIDALVSGSMLYFMKTDIWVAAGIIGTVTFICSLIGFNICRIFKQFSPHILEISSGVILIGLGCKILFEHLYLQ